MTRHVHCTRDITKIFCFVWVICTSLHLPVFLQYALVYHDWERRVWRDAEEALLKTSSTAAQCVFANCSCCCYNDLHTPLPFCDGIFQSSPTPPLTRTKWGCVIPACCVSLNLFTLARTCVSLWQRQVESFLETQKEKRCRVYFLFILIKLFSTCMYTNTDVLYII